MKGNADNLKLRPNAIWHFEPLVENSSNLWIQYIFDVRVSVISQYHRYHFNTMDTPKTCSVHARLDYLIFRNADEMVEKKSSEVHMHEIDPSALELLVEYTYTSQIIISENNVQVLVLSFEQFSCYWSQNNVYSNY